MKIKTKYTIYGILYLIISVISIYLIDSVFYPFVVKPDIYRFCILVLVSFAWWKSLTGMCKYIVYIRFLKLANEAKTTMENMESDQNKIQESCKILREELMKHGDLYSGFISSIESSLKEQKVTGLPFQPESDIADKILKRIIGEE